MSALVLKSVSHLYRIFRVYLALAILGAFSVLAYELLISKPLGILLFFISFSFVLAGILLWYQAKTSSLGRTLEDKKPPQLPESLMWVMLPADQREVIIGDLNKVFFNLRFKYGALSAAIWYALQSTKLVSRSIPIHISEAINVASHTNKKP